MKAMLGRLDESRIANCMESRLQPLTRPFVQDGFEHIVGHGAGFDDLVTNRHPSYLGNLAATSIAA